MYFTFIKKTNKYFCISFWRFLFILFIFGYFHSISLWADTLQLKNGKEIEGFFLKEYANKIIFLDMNNKKHVIASPQISKLEFGVIGIPFCYQYKGDDPSEQNCKALFISVDDQNIVISRGKGFRNINKIEIEDLESVELKYNKLNYSFKPQLKKGLNIEIKSSKRIFTGVLVSYNKSSIRLQEKKGIIRKYLIRNIKSLVIQFNHTRSSQEEEMAYSDSHFMWDIFNVSPGIVQFRRGQIIKGLFFSLGFTWLAYEAQKQAQGASRVSEEARALEFDNSLTRGQEIEEKQKEFNQHEEKRKVFVNALIASYSLYVIDAIFFDGPKRPMKKTTLLFAPILNSVVVLPSRGGGTRGPRKISGGFSLSSSF